MSTATLKWRRVGNSHYSARKGTLRIYPTTSGEWLVAIQNPCLVGEWGALDQPFRLRKEAEDHAQTIGDLLDRCAAENRNLYDDDSDTEIIGPVGWDFFNNQN